MVKVGLWDLMWIWEIIQVYKEEWKTKKVRIADKRAVLSQKIIAHFQLIHFPFDFYLMYLF